MRTAAQRRAGLLENAHTRGRIEHAPQLGSLESKFFKIIKRKTLPIDESYLTELFISDLDIGEIGILRWVSTCLSPVWGSSRGTALEVHLRINLNSFRIIERKIHKIHLTGTFISDVYWRNWRFSRGTNMFYPLYLPITANFL